MNAVVIATRKAPEMDRLAERYPAALLPLFDRPFIQHVVEYLAGQGDLRLVLASENRSQPDLETGSSVLEHVLWFDSVHELLDALLGIRVGSEELERGTRTFVVPKVFGLGQVLVGVLSVLVLLGFPFAKNLFYPAHLFMVQYLRATHDVLPLRTLLKPAGFLIAVILLVTFGLRHALNRIARRRPPFARIAGAVFKVVQAGFYAYCGVNIVFLAGTYYLQPEHFQQYARIEYLRFNPLLRPLTSDLPDMRLTEFNRLLASDDPNDHAKALAVGIGYRPDDPRFKDIFMGLAMLLVDRMHNTEAAGILLSRYMEYERSIRDRESANQDIADTVDAVRAITSKYGWGGSDEFQSFLEGLGVRYGVDS